MKHIIVGTAGHVDHGKTCLIKALTGTDTDRLQEEKKRGITIELGFTNMPVEQDMKIGIIDVPGHEKFVKNMLAGIGGIDLVLLVIALDEGVMPQTREHFEVLKMLEIKKGIIVLTKADTVEPDWADLVEEEVKDLVEGSFLEGAPTIRVSSYTGMNIPELKQLIVSQVEDTQERLNEEALFRLPIDRVFTMEGFGTVITGTLLEGSVHVGQEVILYPEEIPIKIRGIQVHGEPVTEAVAGQRTAINLANISKEEIQRGNVLAAPGCLRLSSFIDVRLTLFPSTKRVLKNNDRVHINFGSAQMLTKVILLDKDSLNGGESAYAQLRFDELVAMKRNDRFIIRFFSPVETFGGGQVLESEAMKHKRGQEKALEDLQVKENGSLGEVLEVMIREESLNTPGIGRLATKLGMTKELTGQLLKELEGQGKIRKTGQDGWYHQELWNRVVEFTKELLTEFHQEHMISPGMSKEEFRSRLLVKFHLPEGKLAEELLEEMSKEQIIGKNKTTIALAKFEAKYNKEFAGVREAIEKRYQEAGYEVPPVTEATDMCKDKKQAQMLIEDMVKDGFLVKVTPPYYMTAKAWNQALEVLETYLKDHDTISLGDYRDLLGTSRKFAVLLLEAFDAKKITIKVGDERKLKQR